MRKYKKRFIKLIARILCLLPSSVFGDIIGKAAIYKASRMNPRDGLKLLFSIDALLYSAQGRLAISYGDGLHTKHKHTRYHDFFTSRIKREEKVLDVGCGNGALACDIATKSEAIVDGIDINERNIEQARIKHHHPKVKYYIGDVTKDLGTGQYDVVVLSNVLEHLSDRVPFLKKLLATTRPDRILIRVPLFERDWRVPLRKEVGEEWRLDPTHETEYTQDQFLHEVNSAGLEVLFFEVRWGEIWAELKAIGD